MDTILRIAENYAGEPCEVFLEGAMVQLYLFSGALISRKHREIRLTKLRLAHLGMVALDWRWKRTLA